MSLYDDRRHVCVMINPDLCDIFREILRFALLFNLSSPLSKLCGCAVPSSRLECQ